MQKPGVRLFLFAALLAAGAGAGMLAWNAQVGIDQRAAAQQDIDARIDRLAAATAALVAAQGAYVAPGQPRDAWLAQVTSLVETISSETAALKAEVRSPASPAMVQAMSERMSAFGDVDSRARDNLSQGNDLFAADLIYADGRAALDGVAATLRGLRDAERAASTTQQARLLLQQWAPIGIAALFWVIGAALLLRRATSPPVPVSAPETAESEPALNLLLRPDAAEPAHPPIDLGAAADLCTSIARMTSMVELPDLLARAAALLDASGIIVWMGAGEELFAVTAHGYDRRVISRLGPIARNTDNATAASWRTGEVKTFAGDVMTDGAVVAPMFAPDACIGVFAAEVRHGREDDVATRAVTAMIASQLATALTTSPAAESRAGAGL
jgi:hypothetical protein